jgi:hypothetical protein
MLRRVSAVTLSVALSACSTTPPAPYSPPPEAVYNALYNDGAREAVDLLREGLRAREAYGYTDPYIPIRTPDEVVPIYVPAYVDADNRRIEGHWEYTVIKESQWYLD